MGREGGAAGLAAEAVLQDERWHCSSSSVLSELQNSIFVLVSEYMLLEIISKSLTIHSFHIQATGSTHHVQALGGLLLDVGDDGAERSGHETALAGVEVVLGPSSVLVPMFACLHPHLVLVLGACNVGREL